MDYATHTHTRTRMHRRTRTRARIFTLHPHIFCPHFHVLRGITLQTPNFRCNVCMFRAMHVCSMLCMYVPCNACMLRAMYVCSMQCMYVPCNACMFHAVYVCLSRSWISLAHFPVASCSWSVMSTSQRKRLHMRLTSVCLARWPTSSATHTSF